MLIDKDYIMNEISSIGEKSFDIVISFVLREILGRTTVNVNGNGDGGCDFRELSRDGSKCELFREQSREGIRIVQVTVQKNRWKEKAISDAKTAKGKYGNVQVFQFFTSRPRKLVELKKLEAEIFSQVGVVAECYGAREIASLIYDAHAFTRLAVLLDRKVPDDIEGRPSIRLRFLHSLFAFHKQRGEIRSEMYDVVLLHHLHEKGHSTFDDLIEYVEKFLKREGRRDEIKSRIDSLLNGKIVKAGSKLVLSADAEDDIKVANQSFGFELDGLSTAVASVLSKFKLNTLVDRAKTIDIALALAKKFASEQCRKLNAVCGSNIVPLPMDFSMDIDLNRLLISYGLKDVAAIRNELIELASKNTLIKRLSNAVVFAWSEYGKGFGSVLSLGQYDWKRVDVILDANVAMPYFLSSIFAPTEDRYSKAINEIVDVLRDRGCSIKIPNSYVSECAGHLREAWEYHEIVDERVDLLQYSQNAYVAHYCQTKISRIKGVPVTFEEYIKAISPYVINENEDWPQRRAAIMESFINRFQIYNMENFNVACGNSGDWRKRIETEYAYILQDRGQTRRSGLVDHDIAVLAYMRDGDDGKDKILLTNDGVVQSLFPKLRTDGRLIISPADAGDLFRTSDSMSEEDLKSLAIAYASTNENPQCLAAQFIDRIIAAGTRSQLDWKMIGEIEQMTAEFVREHAGKGPQPIKQKEIDEYLRSKGVKVCSVD